jgi:hypothetical protein
MGRQIFMIFDFCNPHSVEEIQNVISQHYDVARSSSFVRVTTSVDSFASLTFC